MNQAEQIKCMKLLMHRLDQGINVDAGGAVINPVDAYTCAERAAEEWKLMFQSYPQVMGLAGDLPEPGSFMTSTELGKPLLLTRDRDGVFQAFVNVCTHRGTVLVQEQRGKKFSFNCSFHGWGFSNSGNLVSVPKEDHFGPVEKHCYNLVKLTAQEKHGLLWVHPEPGQTFDLAALLGDLGDELDSWGFDKLSFGALDNYQTPMNWKLAIDTFGETYHFPVLHKDTLGQNVYGNVQCYDTFGNNHRMLLCSKAIDLFRDLPEQEWDLLAATIPVYYLFPNIQLIPSGRLPGRPKGEMSGATLVRVYPNKDNPHESFSQVSFYTNPAVPQDFQEGISERLAGFSEIIRDEDYKAAATCHTGATSGALKHFTFGRNEPALHHYHNTYNRVLGLDPLQYISN
jgi:phenylpropionate dioxygenase-like ring-hydroxylating dioxygenase large terminal subunit